VCTDLRERGHPECGWKPGGSLRRGEARTGRQGEGERATSRLDGAGLLMEGAAACEPQLVLIAPCYRLASDVGASVGPRRRCGSQLSRSVGPHEQRFQELDRGRGRPRTTSVHHRFAGRPNFASTPSCRGYPRGARVPLGRALRRHRHRDHRGWMEWCCGASVSALPKRPGAQRCSGSLGTASRCARRQRRPSLSDYVRIYRR
jgi:hypothetical protein